jgi:hypothetical protein
MQHAARVLFESLPLALCLAAPFLMVRSHEDLMRWHDMRCHVEMIRLVVVDD